MAADLQAYGVFRELEDTYEPYDTQEGERSAGLGSLAAHR